MPLCVSMLFVVIAIIVKLYFQRSSYASDYNSNQVADKTSKYKEKKMSIRNNIEKRLGAFSHYTEDNDSGKYCTDYYYQNSEIFDLLTHIWLTVHNYTSSTNIPI